MVVLFGARTKSTYVDGGDLMKEFKEFSQSVGKSVGHMLGTSNRPFKLLIIIQDCAELGKLIQRAKTLQAEVVMTSGK